MVVCTIQHQHVNLVALESARCIQAAEPATDDDDTWAATLADPRRHHHAAWLLTAAAAWTPSCRPRRRDSGRCAPRQARLPAIDGKAPASRRRTHPFPPARRATNSRWVLLPARASPAPAGTGIRPPPPCRRGPPTPRAGDRPTT